jgi:hypothetical protein
MKQLVPVIVAMSAVASVAAGGAVPVARAVPAAGWRAAMTGRGALNSSGNVEVSSVSCGSAGYCAAGGFYLGGRGVGGFVAGERDGRWGKATGVPGLAALNTGGNALVFSVSCGSAGTARPAASTPTVTARSRGSWLASGTAAGAKRPAWPGLWA